MAVEDAAHTVRTDDPDIVTLVGDSVAVRPVDAAAVSVTVPLNPPCEVMVIVSVLHAPWTTVRLVGLAVMVKSWTLKVTFAVCERLPLVPVTVTV